MNKPAPSSLQHDYAPNSLEARVSEATNHFGLSLMRAANGPVSKGSSKQLENTVISPLSLQILMNIILLGTKDQSGAQLELAKALGYSDEVVAGLSLKKSANSTGAGAGAADDRARVLKPHQAMHNVVESITKAVHLSVDDRHLQRLLLNSNPSMSAGDTLEAHLQTTNRDNDIPLSGQVNFTLANLMLTNKDLLKTSAEYEKELSEYYSVKVEQFSRASQTGEQKADEKPLHVRLNDWVRNITQGQIDNLVEQSTLQDPRLLLVLMNAAHFKGQWLHTFNSRLTEDRTFYNFGTEPKDTKFMRQNGAFAYAEFRPPAQRTRRDGAETSGSSGPSESVAADENETTVIELAGSEAEQSRQKLAASINCSALTLPFSLNDGQELSMVILLPNERNGLPAMLEKLDAASLTEIYSSLDDTQTVQVELPKFTIEAKHEVRPMLESMGVARIFDPSTAELGRMFAGGNHTEPSSVGKVIHKAKIAVDEQGAEASAASMATVVMRSSIRVTIPTFTADHPFFYVIRHSRSNMPLFMGQVVSF